MDELTMVYDGSDKAKEVLIQMAEVAREFNEGPVRLEILCISEKTRTSQQNRAMHKWFGMLAETLNDAGFEQFVVFDEIRKKKGGYDVPWNTARVKENLYKPIMEKMTGKDSTTQMDTKEPSEICDVLGRWLSETFGITPPAWPSQENQRIESQMRNAA
jgi:hypothetical protein